MKAIKDFMTSIDQYQKMRSWFGLAPASAEYAAEQTKMINDNVTRYLLDHPEELED